MFGRSVAPSLSINLEEIKDIAKKNILSRISIPGVQPKISLDLESIDNTASRLTIVGFMGDFILKPPSDKYPNLPENEHLSMLLAEEFAINVAQSSLIKLKSGELSFLSKRFDRQGKFKLAQEDFCQLSERLTEDKYKGSYEGIGRLILKFTDSPGVDIARFFQLIVFCYLIGNTDMHLKNFSLLTDEDGRVKLSPAYDLLSIKLFLPEDDEELALTLNGKKNKIQLKDFEEFGKTLKIPSPAISKILERIESMEKKLISRLESYPFSQIILPKYDEIIQKNYRKMFG
jgi:serine/threonine-protein kinase HipA